jgi:outer membrane protein assembly factor BamB
VSGLNPGLVVVLEPEDVAPLASWQDSHCLLDVLLRDADAVHAARTAITQSGGYGRTTAREYDGEHLPYVDNMANLIVVDTGCQMPDAGTEILRVLAPRGVAIVREKGNEGWLSRIPHPASRIADGFVMFAKPVPAELDDWTHYLYDASNNAVSKDSLVGPPRRIQWVGSPKRARHHDHIASVSALACASGRVFFINDAGSSRSIHLPPKWSLIARDAFNGNILWTKDIPKWVNPLWPLKSGPAATPRRLVASGKQVFVTLGIDAPVSLLDAQTGEQIRVFPETRFARELIVFEDTLLCVTATEAADYDAYEPSHQRSPEEQKVVDGRWGLQNEMRRVVAIDPASGKLLWQTQSPVTRLSLAASNGRVFFHDGSRIHAVGLDSGKELWVSEPLGQLPVLSPSYGPDLVAMPDIVLFAGGNRRMTALAAASGKPLWQAQHPPSGYRSPEDLFVIGGRVMAAGIRNIQPSSTGEFQVHDLLTGQQQTVFPADTLKHFPHHRCYRSKATEKYILTSRTGIEFVDTATGQWQNNFWVRGGCLVGVMPANGLVYAPPHHCACFSAAKLEGFHALAPGPVPTFDEDDSKRLQTGPAYERLLDVRVDHAGDDAWPMHRRDAARSGFLPVPISPRLQDGWTAVLGGRLTSPVIAGGKAVVASIDAHTLHAFDAVSGRKVWQFVAGGRVDSAPTLFQGRVLFGCADGWIYCLDASNGELAWRFRAAPAARLHGAYEQIESVWPVHGSILIQKDVIDAVAGRSRFTDGGLRLLRIDPFTGKKASEITYDERDHRTGEDLHRQFDWRFQPPEETDKWIRMTFQDVGTTDILTAEDGHVSMRNFVLDFDPPATTPSARPKGSKLRSPFGLLDPTWSHRVGWSRWPGPTSRILVFDRDERVFGFGFNIRYQVLNTFDPYLYGKSLNGREVKTLWPDQQIPFFVTAMALADNMLFVAGPPDIKIIDQREIYKSAAQPEFRERLAHQSRILSGDEGAILWIMDKRDGKKLAEYRLEHLPVFDGMAVASQSIFLSTADGRLVCMVSKPTAE